jgi:hypothetical protein
MEAWNELHNMQRNAERAEEAERERKMRIEAAKPIKMTALNRYEAKAAEKELKSLAKKLEEADLTAKQMEPEEGSTNEKAIKEYRNAMQIANNLREAYNNKESGYREWLSNFSGDDVDAMDKIKPGKKLDLKKAKYYLKEAGGDQQKAAYLAEQDGYEE